MQERLTFSPERLSSVFSESWRASLMRMLPDIKVSQKSEGIKAVLVNTRMFLRAIIEIGTIPWHFAKSLYAVVREDGEIPEEIQGIIDYFIANEEMLSPLVPWEDIEKLIAGCNLLSSDILRIGNAKLYDQILDQYQILYKMLVARDTTTTAAREFSRKLIVIQIQQKIIPLLKKSSCFRRELQDTANALRG